MGNDTGMAEKRVKLEGQAAIDLWQEGVGAWNAWVEANPVADVSFRGADFTEFGGVSFKRFKFPTGNVDFSGTTFGNGNVDFSGTTFGDGDVEFSNITFGDGNVGFLRMVFKGLFLMRSNNNTHTIKKISFQGCVFESILILEGEFTCVPDLRGTITKTHVDLQGLRVSPKFDGDPEKTAAALRRLKELAETNRHHEAALRYHADEKRALRPTLPLASRWLDWCFDKLSNYGQSIGSPAFGVLAMVGAFALLYAAPVFTATKCDTAACSIWSRALEAFSFSLTNILPFVASARAVRVDASNVLFGDNPGFWIDFASMAQGLVGFGLLFLIGLGLRNRFRI